MLFAFLIAGSIIDADAQTYQIGHISLTFIDSARSNRPVPTEIYYPADVTGDNTPFSSLITGKVPCISFGHGFVMAYDAYFNIRDAIVSKGYIMAFPTTEGSLSPSHSDFGKDLAFVLKKVLSLSGLSSYPIYNRVDTFNCVMGHSMGGGSSFLAMSYDPTIKSIVTFAAAETTPSAIGVTSSISAPALVFAGLNDCVSPPPANQQPMYNGLSSPCKHYIGIKGGSHCQMAEANLACNFGESSCTPVPTISRITQHAIIDTYLIRWLDYTLKSSCISGTHFESILSTDTTVTVLKNCSLCSTSGITSEQGPHQLKLYPNPCKNEVTFALNGNEYSSIKIISMTGTNMLSIPLGVNQQISTINFLNGIYIYEITGPAIKLIRGIFQVRK